MLSGDDIAEEGVYCACRDDARDAVAQAEGVGLVGDGREMPGDFERIAVFDFDLSGLCALGQRDAIETGFQEGNPVSFFLRQVAENLGEGAALEAEFDRFGDEQAAAGQ